MLDLLLQVEGVKVPAVCDLIPERAERGIEIVEERTEKAYPVHAYLDYKEMFEKEELDAVVIATTWITHAMIAVDAMNAGLHVGMEVGGAASIEECWEMVRTSQRTGKICMLLENCCYCRNEMAVFNMIRKGIFGEIVHMEGGYRHDLRDEICLGRENIHGRLYNFIHRNGEVYPTHQLGPIAKALNINRGNRFLTVNSVASKSRGLHQWIKDNKGEEYDLYNTNFNCGDIVTTIIKCANGETIKLTHDCSLPRPYTRDYEVQGTKGIYSEPEDGKGRRTVLDEYRLQTRGGKGVRNYDVEKAGKVAGVRMVNDDDDIILISMSGIIIRMHADDIAAQSRYAGGVKVMRLDSEDKAVTFAVTMREDAEETEAPQADTAAEEAGENTEGTEE